VRCARCGNENSETNRFCGMCGATLLQGSTSQGSTLQGATSHSSMQNVPPSPPHTSAPVPPPVPPRSVERPVEREEPAITGPSFLGLNQQALNQPTARASISGTSNRLSIDPNAAPSSRSLDYLLDDDDAPRSGGAGKFVLILVALALAAGLGYLRWRNQGFGWLGSGNSKPSAASQSSDSSNPGSAASTPQTGETSLPAPSANPPSGASAQSPVSAGNSSGNAVASNPAPPATTSSNSNTNSATPPAANQSSPSQDSSAQASSNQSASNQSASDQSNSTQPSTNQVAANQAPSKHAAAPSSAQTTASDNADDDASNTDADASAKPAAAVKPAKPADPVAEAQKYIYGRGTSQNCDRGLQILKPAADRANPKAMIEMGALYSAGLCTPRDLPTAYRWFAMALRKDPDNQSVQTDLEKLWGEMTQPERQLAMKLSQ
jgi:hypothetical protein